MSVAARHVQPHRTMVQNVSRVAPSLFSVRMVLLGLGTVRNPCENSVRVCDISLNGNAIFHRVWEADAIYFIEGRGYIIIGYPSSAHESRGFGRSEIW